MNIKIPNMTKTSVDFGFFTYMQQGPLRYNAELI